MVERKRHLAKAVTYRVFGSAGTAAVAYVVTGSAAVGAGAGLADSVIKIALYYVHERIWYRVRWGVKAPDAAGSGGAEAAEVADVRRETVVVLPDAARRPLERPAAARA